MTTEYDNSKLGDISVDNEVIKNIALKAAMDVHGICEVKKWGIGRLVSAVTKKKAASGVRLDFSDSSEARITMKLMVDYGTNIPVAAGAVQENVKKSVEYMTGITVSEVIIKVIGMRAKKGQSARGGIESVIVDEPLSVNKEIAAQ